MKAKKVIIEFDGHETLEITLSDFETLIFSETRGMSVAWDEKTNSERKKPNGRRYIAMQITPRDETDYFENIPR